jgi:hypothetical protein
MEKQGGNYIWLGKDKTPLCLKNLNPFWRDVHVYKAWNNAVLTG